MGEVFLAEDPRLGRRVAIKRPSEKMLGDVEARARLRREAYAAAQLNHPNVAGIYDVLDTEPEGVPHIVMEYVEGESLASVVSRGSLESEAALRFGRQIAEALVHAHDKSIIHRDLKPANVMITPDGRAKVLDFGLARPALADSTVEPNRAVSQVYGTPGYMAPEQLMGHRGDARSDIYSFGALFFELLTGEPPYKSAGQLERVLSGSGKAPQPRAVNPRIPAALDQVVVRAMAFDPRDRFQSAETLRHALEGAAAQLSEAETGPVAQPPIESSRIRSTRSIVAVTAAVLLVVVAALWWRARDRPGAGPPPAVAVLPFESASSEADLEALGAGLADMIVNGLAASGGITTVARSALPTYDDRNFTESDLQEIARELGVDRVVGGAVRRTPAGIELTIRIVRARQQQDWQRSYPGSLEDVLSLGRRILGDLVAELGAEAPAAPPLTQASIEAFQQYSQARSFIDRRDVPGSLDRAIQLLEAALKREPNFALAQAALGEAFWQKWQQTKDPAWVDRAERQTLLALSTDANQPLVRLLLATMLHGTGQSERAEQELRQITQNHPLDAAHRLLGMILFERGEVDAALNEFTRAIELRPGYWLHHSTKGVAALRANRYGQAEAPFLRAIELQPDHADAYGYLGTVYLYSGRRDRAIEYYKRSIQASPTPAAWSNLGAALSDGGQLEEALDAFRQAVALRPRDPLLHRNLGDVLARLGKRDEARSAYTEGARLARNILAVNARSAEAHGALAICLAKLGEFDEAMRHADQSVTQAPAAYQPYHRKAAVLALAGRSNEAMAALGEAFRRGLAPPVVVRDDDFDSLEKLPEFQQLVKGGR